MNRLLMEVGVVFFIGVVIGYGVYSVMEEKVEILERANSKLEGERCPYGRACDIYNKKGRKEVLDRVVNLLIRRVNNCNKGLCDGCNNGCEKSDAIKVLNEIRKV